MINDKKCRDVLSLWIAKITTEFSSTYTKEIEKDMTKRFNVRYATAIDIFNNVLPLETMSYELMYKLMVSIKEVTTNLYSEFDISDLDTSLYFTKIEEDLYAEPYVNKKSDKEIVIKNWYRVQMDGYDIITVFIDADELLNWRDNNKIRFNPETQRDLIVIETQGIPIKKLDLNKKSIEEMKELMLAGRYFPVAGTININPEYCDDEPFYIKNGNLIIPQGSPMDLIEGFHNYTAITDVKNENPNWNFPVEYKIMTLTKNRANEFIGQMDKKNHLREAQSTRTDTDKKTNYLLATLNTSSDFMLKGTINNKIYLFLFNTIEKIFQIGSSTKRAATVCSLIEKNANYMVEKTDHYDIPFTKEEWFLVLYTTKFSLDNNIKFSDIYNKIDVNSLIKELKNGKMQDKPKNYHYSIMESKLKEVISDEI